MPRLLKSETGQRLATSQRALTIAITLLSTPRTVGHEPNATDCAIEIGLIGIAADLAISACLYEILGSTGIKRKDSGFFFTASEALKLFQETLQSKIPRLSVLTQGLSDPVAHLKKIDEACRTFPVIFSARAAAVHAGTGTSIDVGTIAAKNVSDFLLTLTECSKWKPYLKQIPVIPKPIKDKTLIAQELASLLESGDKSTAGTALAGLYLVLPELTNAIPDWLDSLQRVQATPRTKDIAVLVKCLQQANVGDIFKVGGGTNATAVKIVDREANPAALPIYTERMKKKFDKPLDTWSGYIGNANGELDKGILALPSIDALYRFAALGVDGIGLPTEDLESGLSSHSIWPFVASALGYSGTKGPCFFLLRFLKSGEMGQLIKQLNSAAKLSRILKKELPNYIPLFQALSKGNTPPANSSLAKGLIDATTKREQRRDSIAEKLTARSKAAPENLKKNYETIISNAQKSHSLGDMMDAVRTKELDMGNDQTSILRFLIDATTDHEDLESIIATLTDPALTSVHTNARKALLEIDYLFYGQAR